uniref:Uncharacterized protein n=1 Tax=Aegilops tauschii subsp. strangulata TaxID=200361 RepID=A0A453RGI6_AEGTS
HYYLVLMLSDSYVLLSCSFSLKKNSLSNTSLLYVIPLLNKTHVMRLNLLV